LVSVTECIKNSKIKTRIVKTFNNFLQKVAFAGDSVDYLRKMNYRSITFENSVSSKRTKTQKCPVEKRTI